MTPVLSRPKRFPYFPDSSITNRSTNRLRNLTQIANVSPSVSSYNCGRPQNWYWRGWQIRYAYLPHPSSQTSVLFVHGFGGSINHWRHNLAELAKHHNVYAIDLLGFGASAKPVLDYNIHLWQEQIYAFWQAQVHKPIVLVGNSIGSLTCLAAAAAHPNMVRGVAMISLPETVDWQAHLPGWLRPLALQLITLITSPLVLQPLFHLLRQPQVLRHWASMAYAGKEAITEELLEILASPARDRDAAGAFSAIFRGMLNPRFSPNIANSLGGLQRPSLLLWGKQDRMIPVQLSRRFLSYNAKLQLVELDNAGHCAHDECPEQVNQALITWIQAQVLPQIV